jgi:uncharacterized protein (UPF0335 family)
MDFKKLIKTYGDACDRSARAPRMSPSQQSAIQLEQQAHLALVESVVALESERDKLAHDHHQVRADAQARVDAAVIRALTAEKERDELRARLAEIEEPVAHYRKSDAEWLQLGGCAIVYRNAAEDWTDPLYTRPVPAIPVGWRLVPVEITEAMHVAAVKTIVRCNGNAEFPPRVWTAMIAAAPEAAR